MVVITGGLGYIGSLLLERIQPGTDRVVVIDDRSARPYRLSSHRAPADLIEDDICTATLPPLISGADVVVHLAAVVDPAPGAEGAGRIDAVNVDGTRRIAEACLRAGVPLVFLSTTSVYGSHSQVVDEDCPAAGLRPHTLYAASKLRAERVLARLGRRGLRYAVLRCGSVFGPSISLRLHPAINRFCWQAAAGKPVTVWRTAMEQRRPYLHIDDAVRAIQFVAEHRLFENRVYNVATVNATVHDILDVIVTRVHDVTVELVHSPLMNELSYAVATRRIREQGFQPRGDLAAGIQDMLDVLRPQRSTAA